MSVIGSNILAGASGNQAAGDTGRSLRFNDSDTAFLSRTPSSASSGNTKLTYSVWVKGANAADKTPILSASSSGGSESIEHRNDGTLVVFFDEYVDGAYTTSAVFRDPSAWYHFVFAIDTTLATAADRVKIYVNGVQVSTTASPALTQNFTFTGFNQQSKVQYIGRTANTSGGVHHYASAMYADIHMIDGQALASTSFGAFDSNGVWQKADYSGSYGTNGFHLLDFENESTVGHDSSGNGNDFTASNISTAAGAGNDVLFDFPANGSGTDTGAGAQINGNYCTFNPVDSNQTHSNGNLFVTCAGGTSPRAGTGTIAVSSGKYYYEITVTESDAAKGIIGFVEAAYDGNGSTIPNSNGNSVFYFGENGNKFIDGSATSYGDSYGNNDVIGVALNLDDDEITFYKNGTSQGTITTKTFTGAYKPAVGRGSSSGSTSYTLNAGQRAFTHAAPSGFKTLNTASLPTATVPDGSDYFEAKTYTGNGDGTNTSDSGPTLTTSFSPDFAWIKSISLAKSHIIHDTIRGERKRLYTNLTNAEFTYDHDKISFNSDGIQITTNDEHYNDNGDTYVAWLWDAGSSTASNTNGSITTSVRANQSAGFSIVTYTGNGTSGATVGHGLNTKPDLLIVKNRDRAVNWVVYHSAVGATKYLPLNLTTAATSWTGFLNDTEPTSSVITLGNGSGPNHNGENIIIYAMHAVEGYSKFGSYTGNGASGYPNADGPFIHLGFRPAFILWKCTSQAENWTIYDTARGPSNYIDNKLNPNSSAAESTNANHEIDFLSNGFKVRNNNGEFNQNNGTYVYAAFSENAFSLNGGLAR